MDTAFYSLGFHPLQYGGRGGGGINGGVGGVGDVGGTGPAEPDGHCAWNRPRGCDGENGRQGGKNGRNLKDKIVVIC